MLYVTNLRQLLELAITANEGTVSGHRLAMGYQQITSGTLAVATKLTVPTGAGTGFVPGYAIIQCSGAAATDYAAWRDDGTAPTSTIGMRLFSGQELDYAGDLALIQFIVGSGSPNLNISYYA